MIAGRSQLDILIYIDGNSLTNLQLAFLNVALVIYSAIRQLLGIGSLYTAELAGEYTLVTNLAATLSIEWGNIQDNASLIAIMNFLSQAAILPDSYHLCLTGRGIHLQGCSIDAL